MQEFEKVTCKRGKKKLTEKELGIKFRSSFNTPKFLVKQGAFLVNFQILQQRWFDLSEDLYTDCFNNRKYLKQVTDQ